MSTALLHRVLGTKSENSQVLEGQQQFDQSQVQLLSKDLTDLVALVLDAGTEDAKAAVSREGHIISMSQQQGDKDLR